MMPGHLSPSSGHIFIREGVYGHKWYAKVRPAGAKQTKLCLGRVWTGKGRPPDGYLTRGTAEARLRELLVEADRGNLAVQHRTGVSFGAVAEEWLEYVEHDRKRSRSTVVNYHCIVRKLPPHWTRTPIEAITEADVEAVRLRLLKDGFAAKTINNYLNVIGAIFKRGMRIHGLRTNPAALVDRQPVKRSGKIDFLDPHEVTRLAAAAKSQWHSALYVFAAYTGLRMGELRELRWSWIDRRRELVHVRGNYVLGRPADPKSGKVRSVPLAAPAAQALDEVAAESELAGRGAGPDDLVFPNPYGEGRFDNSRAVKELREALSRADVRKVRFHDLRHTFGTVAADVFFLPAVQAYMGHATITTTMIYVHHRNHGEDAAKLSGYLATRTGGAGDLDSPKLVPNLVPDSAVLGSPSGDEKERKDLESDQKP